MHEVPRSEEGQKLLDAHERARSGVLILARQLEAAEKEYDAVVTAAKSKVEQARRDLNTAHGVEGEAAMAIARLVKRQRAEAKAQAGSTDSEVAQ